MYSKQKIILILGLLLFNNILQADELAIKRFQSALGACERALQMDMPKSQGSLKILQSLLKRYQRNKKFALELDGTLKDSTEHHYNGEFFNAETFKQAFQTCESQLTAKMNEAEKVVSEKITERKNKQQEQEEIVEALVEKIEKAKQQVKIAVEENCVIYSQMVLQADEEKSSLSKTKIASLHQGYTKAKQKALEIYPDIIKQFYTATIVDPFTAEKKQESKAIVNWFKYCEESFAERISAETTSVPVGPERPEEISPTDKKSLSAPESAVVEEEEEEEKPVVPPTAEEEESSKTHVDEETEAESQATEKETEAEEAVADSATEEEPVDEEVGEDVIDYQKIASTMQKDKAKILKENNRLPDYVNNAEDDFQAATIWQYANDDNCTIYQFKGDKLVKKKVVPGECPEL